MRNFTLLACVLGLGFSAQAWSAPHTTNTVDYATCEKMMASLDQVADLDLLADCSNFYWHNEQYDVPEGSYNKVIAIGKRTVAVDPSDYDTWNTTAWLLWSKWVTWTVHPEKMPDGVGKVDEAYALLVEGQGYNLTNAIYHWQAASTAWLMAKSYSPEYYPFTLDSYQRADNFAPDNDLKIRSRFQLGLIYQNELKDNALALHWYKKVLEIDPSHSGALNGIKEIGGN